MGSLAAMRVGRVRANGVSVFRFSLLVSTPVFTSLSFGSGVCVFMRSQHTGVESRALSRLLDATSEF